jgi:3-hydroxyacyl-CoA dehydrogenase/enoyl-CoA hydratase/3-hydroxybutyryl-CoA epimerase
LNSLSTAKPEEFRDIIELGQQTFNVISELKIPTIAAIHGACVGGGYEICLACDYRIASPEKATKIGLPETQLGILPAWGGSARLPRLIGLPKALDIILGGKTVAAKKALKLGMVDEVVPREYLIQEACKRILSRGRSLRKRKRHFVWNNPLTAKLVHKRASQTALSKTRGHYPAIPKALDVVVGGLSCSLDGALGLERDGIVELAGTEAAKNLIRVFFLQERAKKLSYAQTATAPAKRVAVIGAGVMGAGIAQWSSARELLVTLKDIGVEPVAKGMAGITKTFEEGVKRHVFTKVEARAGVDRIYPVTTDVPLRNTDIIIEAAVEKMDLKKKIFQRLDELAGPETILATNTSALSISEIASATRHPERVVGIHFFNPVHRMQLVEVVVGKQTSPEVVQRSVKFVQQIGKLPVVVKDSPGFLVNRILMPYLIEAGYLFENGARVEDVDESMLEFGMPMGPLRLTDEVGIDVANHVAETIAHYFSPRLTAPAVLGKMMEAGLLGRKNKCGFYDYAGKNREGRVNLNVGKFQTETSAAGLRRDELQFRMVSLMINEAARCLEEQLVAEPADVDFGMIMGTGFAPFRGGPLRFADHLGIPKLVSDMKELAVRGGERFGPCALLNSMAAENRTFYS